MEQFALYLVLRDLFKKWGVALSPSFNDVDSNGRNVMGVFIRSGGASKYRNIASGKYYNYSSRVQVLLYGDLSSNSLMDVLSAAGIIRNNIVQENNSEHLITSKFRFNDGNLVYVGSEEELSEDVIVRFARVSLLSEVSFVGKTTQGVPRYSLNFKVNYSIGGKADGAE